MKGDYTRLTDRFSVLSRGKLPLTDVLDHVDIEAGGAWLQFAMSEQRVRWDLIVDNDWMDPLFT
jgi:hypothetical protein